MTHEFDPTTSVIVDCELPEPREKVWKALTVPELLAKWLMPNDIRPEVGARFQLTPRNVRQPGEVGSIECQVLEAELNRRLRLRWREVEEGDAEGQRNVVHSIVTFELAETVTGGTHLRLVHEGFEIVAIKAVSSTVLQLRRSERRKARHIRRPIAAIVSMPIQLRRAA